MRKRRKSYKKVKYPALDPQVNLKTRYKEIADIDYLDQLNDEELAWLNKFMKETVNADFRHSDPLHNSNEKRREIYRENNSRNRDVYTLSEAGNKLGSAVDYKDLTMEGFEDMIITKIDLERKKS